eukprot:TRINITY_DN1234_c0_g1::TRINITY_DN1234_c0_g1_i1::g.26814::m.26814 TRINITY_DN1234_c0_g1::TRINITY_DN1234_c0_g1_i1::g.26814  ORF type:complete len:152 (-),score=27.51,sp/Q39584/DYL3_CHLRE/52.00/2e-50,EF-hand_1/PF00036.27/0.00022,EF-hand_1/PF00036.27/9.6e-06,EF-hand_1/PF00036.27/3.1e-08,EF-hand_7/PF13499.1/1.7e-13,EF-hand_7/PF13499.1/0.0002,EF-hand_6/PF13405.1/3e-06,EF-hand_6/PF13405.1/0.011,EF-hand_6/PF13405.1/1.1e+04,EF-hand_6/PF13405.1/0.00078,EF-hand_8/PF13833.1/0.062,EF-hand_8/PF13833.1/5.4e-09,E
MAHEITLTQAEIDACREAFEKFDADGSGSIDQWELKKTLQAMGQNPTDDELFQMISMVDDDGSGCIEFAEFLKVIENQKRLAAGQDDETDTISAFVALGGNPDKSGEVATQLLKNIVNEFGLTIDIDQLIAEADTDNSGFIDYEEFKKMLS